MRRSIEEMPVSTCEAREALAAAGLAAPDDLDLRGVDADLAQYLMTHPEPSGVVLRAFGFTEDLSNLITAPRAQTSTPGGYQSSDRMDPSERYAIAAQPQESVIWPYNT